MHFKSAAQKKNHISMWFYRAGICGFFGSEDAGPDVSREPTQAGISFISLAFTIACTRLLTRNLL